jgi:hypothetical protein
MMIFSMASHSKSNRKPEGCKPPWLQKRAWVNRPSRLQKAVKLTG